MGFTGEWFEKVIKIVFVTGFKTQEEEINNSFSMEHCMW